MILIGRCRVVYRGRAESTLPAGDRIVLVKADGTLHIHNPEGLKPVNWQPAGCTFRVEAKAHELILEATRRRPEETVRVTFDRLLLAGVEHLENGRPLELRGTEFDLRDALRAHPELVEEGFVPWAAERLTERGPMDLYGEDAQGRRVVVEVKRVRAGIAEATQLWRYVEQERKKRQVTVRGILMAPAASERALQLLADHGLEFRPLSLDRLRTAGVPLQSLGQPSLLSYDAPPSQTGND